MNMREKMARIRCKTCHHPGASQCRGPDCWCWENELRGIDAILDVLTENPGDAVVDAGDRQSRALDEENSGEVFCAMIEAIKEGK